MKITTWLERLSLSAYLLISILLVGLCALVFPDRLGSLLGFVNRLFLATVFVNVVWAVQGLDQEDKPLVIGMALIGAGMAV